MTIPSVGDRITSVGLIAEHTRVGSCQAVPLSVWLYAVSDLDETSLSSQPEFCSFDSLNITSSLTAFSTLRGLLYLTERNFAGIIVPDTQSWFGRIISHMGERWTRPQWKTALTGEDSQAEAEAYHRLSEYLFGYAKYFLFEKRGDHIYLRRQSEKDVHAYAWDCVQHAVEAFYRNLINGVFDWKALPTTYATTILIRHINRDLERRGREILDDFGDYQTDSEDDDYMGEYIRRQSGPERENPAATTEREVLLSTVAECIERLSEMQRLSFVWFCLRDESGKAVAAKLETSTDAIYKNVSRARKYLQECLAESGFTRHSFARLI